MTEQIAVKLPDEMVAAVDRLVAAGRFSSRSGAVRAGLELVVREAEREVVDRAFADGFKRHPERDEEMRDARRLAIEAIDDEPWEPWW
jgi:Arc/MetJ-type ribon-helix-helix transcriptional regulator